jgi:hypothetical protein
MILISLTFVILNVVVIHAVHQLLSSGSGVKLPHKVIKDLGEGPRFYQWLAKSNGHKNTEEVVEEGRRKAQNKNENIFM